jgi:protease II
MTLSEWAEQNNAVVRDWIKPTYDPMKTIIDRDYPDRWGLFHLTDYVVTSVEAGTIWLAERKNPLV